VEAPIEESPMTNSSQSTSLTPAEHARLSVFKAAVAAGLYTDALSAESEPYHFSAAELDRLMIYRLAVAAGFFTDELEAGARAGAGA
jgi:hypothetical protein